MYFFFFKFNSDLVSPPSPYSMLYKNEASLGYKKYSIVWGEGGLLEWGGGGIWMMRGAICPRFTKLVQCLNPFVAYCSFL